MQFWKKWFAFNNSASLETQVKKLEAKLCGTQKSLDNACGQFNVTLADHNIRIENLERVLRVTLADNKKLSNKLAQYERHNDSELQHHRREFRARRREEQEQERKFA